MTDEQVKQLQEEVCVLFELYEDEIYVTGLVTLDGSLAPGLDWSGIRALLKSCLK